MDEMKEKLLHYVWKHRLFPSEPLTTVDGERVEVLDPGLWNHDAGPDFFNAKLMVAGEHWAGNVELHLKSSDWARHNHQADTAYDNVVLHVVNEVDSEVFTASGRRLPQLRLAIPEQVERNFCELMAEEAYPPCYRIIPSVPKVSVNAWLSALTVERLEQKTLRIEQYLTRTGGDWERAFFITLARALGLGVNSDAFEHWAASIDLLQAGKHRDQLLQVEAFFLGMAGLLERCKDSQSDLRQREWNFLRNKFSLTSMDPAMWRYLRMRPQSFPHVRIMQMASLFHEGRLTLSALLQASGADSVRTLLAESLTALQASTIDILVINAAAPILFCHGRSHDNEQHTDLAFELLEQTRAESNFITRCWRQAGLSVSHAADSQALIQLRRQYCDRKDCLRCRFGALYMRDMRAGNPTTSLTND